VVAPESDCTCRGRLPSPEGSRALDGKYVTFRNKSWFRLEAPRGVGRWSGTTVRGIPGAYVTVEGVAPGLLVPDVNETSTWWGRAEFRSPVGPGDPWMETPSLRSGVRSGQANRP
jgi:hypothetical protein